MKVRRPLINLLISLLITTSGSINASAEDAKSIIQCMQDKQLQRWQGVNSYAVEQIVAGQKITEYFQRIDVKAGDGKLYPVFQRVPADQYQAARQSPAAKQMDSAEFMQIYADGADAVAAEMGREIEHGLEQAGLPGGLLAATGSDPFATLDPRVMMGPAAQMLRQTAAHKREQQASGDNSAAQQAGQIDDMNAFVESARLVGIEKVDGIAAYHLRSDKVQSLQKVDGQSFNLQRADYWIDKQRCVPLKMRIEGSASSNGDTRPVYFESSQRDYRKVAGSNMLEPYLKVMRMGGVMDPAQQAEMKRAQQEMAKLEQQMASMPANQRAMMESMIGPQMKTMRTMANDGVFESEIVVKGIKVNAMP